MANTYTLIQAQTLASATLTVTFSSIPATYTDLVLRHSARTVSADPNEILVYTFNGGVGGTTYSVTQVRGNGSVANSNATTNASSLYGGYTDADAATANTFGNAEVYIPSYLVAQNKPVSSFSVSENNSAAAGAAWIVANAGLSRSTAAVSSIVIAGINGVNFMANSSFYLYGIKNS